MINEYIRYTVPEGRADDFIADYGRAVEWLDRSEHCEGWHLAQCVEDRETFIMRIDWTSSDAHRNGFRQSAEFQEFLPHVRPWIDHLAEMRHYAPVNLRNRPEAE